MTIHDSREVPLAMEDSQMIVILCSVGGLLVLLLSIVFCSWCFKSRKSAEDEENVFGKKYAVNGQDEEVGTSNLMFKRTPDDKLSIGSASSLNQRAVHSPMLGRKPIKFERPERKLVTETVQPTPGSHTALNQQLGIRDTRDYQTMGITRGVSLSSQSRSASEEDGREGTDNSSSMWRNVKSIATMLMEDPEVVEERATGPIVEGVDFKLGRIQFGLMYDFQNLTLSLRIIRAVDLPAKDVTGTSDPYVKILLLPDKKHKLLTKVKKRNLNPHWNECFLFEGNHWQTIIGRQTDGWMDGCGIPKFLGPRVSRLDLVIAAGLMYRLSHFIYPAHHLPACV